MLQASYTASILGLVGYDARLTRERSRVQSSEDVLLHSN